MTAPTARSGAVAGAADGAYAQGVLDGRARERDRLRTLTGHELVRELFPTDGPYDDERTSRAAVVLGEVVRYLNYATAAEVGMRYPSTAGDLIGSLRTVFQRLGQTLDQTGHRLSVIADQPDAYVNNPRPEDREHPNMPNPQETALVTATQLDHLRAGLTDALALLSTAQIYANRIGLHLTDDDEEERQG
ncbi:hypothetical protein [Micromonospora sp. WMMC273]|uniref:hypothetical protein n=1 Tax=Micromonospora sp. WMMC273 TaxID=3015157 RepID=UPI0022B72D2A|nr:hypothetical protein [Micromonospora sp. WMMC273]MCZ7478915.1 hypothetical protein [Micromonospora sp. WMMC273]